MGASFCLRMEIGGRFFRSVSYHNPYPISNRIFSLFLNNNNLSSFFSYWSGCSRSGGVLDCFDMLGGEFSIVGVFRCVRRAIFVSAK